MLLETEHGSDFEQNLWIENGSDSVGCGQQSETQNLTSTTMPKENGKGQFSPPQCGFGAAYVTHGFYSAL